MRPILRHSWRPRSAIALDGEPGVQTIWLGLQRIIDFAAGVRFSRELQAAGTCVYRGGVNPKNGS